MSGTTPSYLRQAAIQACAVAACATRSDIVPLQTKRFTRLSGRSLAQRPQCPWARCGSAPRLRGSVGSPPSSNGIPCHYGRGVGRDDSIQRCAVVSILLYHPQAGARSEQLFTQSVVAMVPCIVAGWTGPGVRPPIPHRLC